MKKIAIKGDGTSETGEKIIKYFEGMGVKNIVEMRGDTGLYYFSLNKSIHSSMYLPIGYTEEFLDGMEEKKFPRYMMVKNSLDFTGVKRLVISNHDDLFQAIYPGYENVLRVGTDFRCEQWKYASEIEEESEISKQITKLKDKMSEISETIKKLEEAEKCSK